jgi:hypothetical protein
MLTDQSSAETPKQRIVTDENQGHLRGQYTEDVVGI